MPGYLLAVREAVKILGNSGSVINVSSILSTDPYLASSVYPATEGAVDPLTFALARELGPRGIEESIRASGGVRGVGY